QAFVPAGAFTLDLPPATRVRQISASGPVRLLSAHSIRLAVAARLHPRPLWLGPRFSGHRVTHISLLRYTGGRAVRISYGPSTVWTYGRVVPPSLLANRLVPLKAGVIGG